MVREEGTARSYDVRYESRDAPPGYGGRKQPSSQASPQPGRRAASEANEYAVAGSYKNADMEQQTIILEKAAPDQGFGIAVSGGLDNPHYETGDTSIIVSDVVETSPADGLLRVHDVILSVNGVNVEAVEHSVAVEALKHSGYSVKLVILRKRPSTTTSSPSSVDAYPEQQASYSHGASNGTGKEPRNVVLSKLPSESYGLALGTILFVKDLDQRGPAGRDGRLEPGDVILKINNKRVDDLSRPDAVTIMRNSPERLDLVVLRNKDVPAGMPPRIPRVNEPISMSKSHMVEGATNGMNGQDLIAFKQGAQDNWNNNLHSTTTYSISSAGKRSDTEKDIDARRDKKFHGEPHLVSFHRATGNSLGIQVAGGNAVGVFAAAIKDGSSAQVAGLRVGDQILSANEIEFKDITREEAVLILLSLPEEVSLLVMFKKSVYDKSKEEPGDSFYVKAQFHYNGGEEDELSFRRGEVFHVLDTMNGGTIGSWRAQRVIQSGAETEVGIVPNKCRAEQLAITQDLEAKKFPNPKQKSGGTLRKSTTPKKKQYQAADQLDETSFQLDVKYPAYERVMRRRAGFIRPVVLLGPIADICRDKLMMEYPEKFTSPATFGRYDAKQQSGIKLSAVKDNLASGKHSLLDVTPDGVEMLNFVGLEPIVIFFQPPSKQLIKDLRHDLTSKNHSARFVKKLFDQAESLNYEHHHLFTSMISLERNNKWYTECVSIIERQQDDVVWMPEQMNQHNDDEVVLQMPRVSVSYDNDPLSHLDNTGDIDASENVPRVVDEDIVVAAASMQESEQAPAVQAYSVTHRVEDEHEAGDAEERELVRRQEEDERAYQRRQEEDRDYQRKEEDERERDLQRRQQEEEREFQRRGTEEKREQQERDYQKRQHDDYERQMEQREYERRQYEDNRRGYDDETRHRDGERKPYVPPGIKVLPGNAPAVVNLKKTDSGGQKSPRDEPFQDDARQTIHLRHVERDAEGEKYDERIGVKVSDVFDIGKDIETTTQEYRKDDRRMEVERRQKSDSDEEDGEFSRRRQDYPPSSEKYESRVVVETRTAQETEKRAEPVEEDLVRTTVKPVEAAPVDLDEMFSNRQVKTSRMQTTVSTTTTSRDSYQVSNQPRNTVIDTSSGRRVESAVMSSYYPAKARAQMVNLDSDKAFSERRRDEPEVKMEFENRVSSEPASYDRRPPVARYDEEPDRRPRYDDEPVPDRRPPVARYDDEPDRRPRYDDEPVPDRRPPVARYDDEPDRRPRYDDEPVPDRRPPAARYDDAPDRRPHYDDEPVPDRRPPPPDDDDHPPPRPKPYSSVYPRPFGTQSSASYNEFRRTAPDYPPGEGRQYNDEYQEPMPENATYRYGSTAYRNPTTDYDDANREATSDFESVGDDEPTVVATARGTFNYRGGTLTSEETGVSVYIPSGAIPTGVEQEIYFKVCKDNSMLPPLDTDKGETLLSPLVMCGPHGTKFMKPVELRLPHSASMTPDGWSFALKSSDTPSGQPTRWKNTNLAEQSEEQCKVSSNSVSVLVDHF